MLINRRDALALTAASAVSLLGTAPVFAKDGDVYDLAKLLTPDGMADRPLGPEDAKVTVIEYASPTCPHCAAFHNDVYPAFKEQYIDSGKVRFILRPFVRNVQDAVVFLLAEASEGDAYHTVVSTYFKTQSQWAASSKPRDALLAVAQQLGFTEESFDAALANQDLFKQLESLREQAVKEFDLEGTPTFYINGKQLSGDRSLEELAAEIDPQLA